MTKLLYVSYVQDKVSWLSVVVPAFNPSTPRQKLAQFKASVDYSVNSRSELHTETISKKKKIQSEFINKKKKYVSTTNLDISVHAASQYTDMSCFLHKSREK